MFNLLFSIARNHSRGKLLYSVSLSTLSAYPQRATIVTLTSRRTNGVRLYLLSTQYARHSDQPWPPAAFTSAAVVAALFLAMALHAADPLVQKAPIEGDASKATGLRM